MQAQKGHILISSSFRLSHMTRGVDGLLGLTKQRNYNSNRAPALLEALTAHIARI